MSFSTFSGPIRAGTVKGGASDNTGLVVLAQSYDTGDLTGTTVGNTDIVPPIVLPKGAQITDIVVDQVVAATGGTTTISVGNAAAGAQLMAGVATTAGGRFRGTATAATQLAWQISNSADQQVYIRVAVATGTLTAGRAIITVMYVQRADNGAQVPASA